MCKPFLSIGTPYRTTTVVSLWDYNKNTGIIRGYPEFCKNYNKQGSKMNGVCVIRVVIVCAAVTLLTRELRMEMLLLSVLYV